MILISAAPCVVRLCLTRLFLKPACVRASSNNAACRDTRDTRGVCVWIPMAFNLTLLFRLPIRLALQPAPDSLASDSYYAHLRAWYAWCSMETVTCLNSQAPGCWALHTSYQIINREQGAEMANIKSSQTEPLKYRLFAISLEPFEPERSSTTHFECLI